MYAGLLLIVLLVGMGFIYTLRDGVGETPPLNTWLDLTVAIVSMVPVISIILYGRRYLKCLLPQSFDPEAIPESVLPQS